MYVNANIYKDDTAFTVVDRILRHSNFSMYSNDKELKKLLANNLE